MAIATSKNLTVVGIGTLVVSIASAAVAFFDGNPATNPNFSEVLGAILGVVAMFAKGAQSTGGTVPETPEAEARVKAS